MEISTKSTKNSENEIPSWRKNKEQVSKNANPKKGPVLKERWKCLTTFNSFDPFPPFFPAFQLFYLTQTHFLISVCRFLHFNLNQFNKFHLIKLQ